MLDTFKHKGRRERLIDSLEKKGISDPHVLEAMRMVPRHFFVETAFQDSAYEDKALPILSGQTISQPYTVAYQTQLLKVKAKIKVLEIGTGSGYQAAILCAMGARLFSIEFLSKLHRIAKSKLEDLGFEPQLKQGDGSKGWPKFAPYQRILVTAASPTIPDTLKSQLEIGGILVIPVGDQKLQQMYVVTRLAKNEYQVEKKDYFRFVPLKGQYGFEGEN